MPTPYIERKAGDLLSAADWNTLQIDIQTDIADQIEKAVGQIDDVSHADDANKLAGKTVEEIKGEIIKEVLKAIPKASGGYESVFLRLDVEEERIIEHGLGAFPLTDVYQLEYFPAICGTGDRRQTEEMRFVNFYLYNTNEVKTRMRGRTERGKTRVFELEEAHHAQLKLSDLLELYDVSYTDSTDLEELEASFWDAFLQRQTTDDFDPAQYGHSPWFEKHGEERTSVKDLKLRGDFERLCLKMHPTKMVNPIMEPQSAAAIPAKSAVSKEKSTVKHQYQNPAAPNQVHVIHYDFDTLGIRLIDRPFCRSLLREGIKREGEVVCPPLPEDFLEELKVMVLMKV